MIFYWLVIFLGIIIISLSISNPFFRLVFKKNINLNLLLTILIRVILLLLGIMLIFMGLYIESII